MEIDTKIEAILLFKNEPVSIQELSKMLDESPQLISEAISRIQEFFAKRGVVVIFDGEKAVFGTHPEASELIEQIQKAELSRDLGRAGLETLTIVLYKGPVSRREIDYIRGVNSGFVLRNLLVRGLIERVESSAGERSFSYKPTLELLRHLGVTKIEDLPEFDTAFKKLEEFSATAESEEIKQSEA